MQSIAPNKAAVILADPPWTFKVRSEKGEGRSASQHYSTMSFEDIAAMPVADWAAPDCALFLWSTDPLLPKAIELMERWGFTYKTVGFNWVKTNPNGGYFCGMGYWSRANAELLLLGTRGHPKRKAKDVRRLIIAPRREHSRKPEEAYESIERLVPGPYLELFARQRRPGWDAMGDQLDKFPAQEPQQMELPL